MFFIKGADDVLTVTCETETGVKAVRKFVRHKPVDKAGNPLPQPNGPNGNNSRKISAPF